MMHFSPVTFSFSGLRADLIKFTLLFIIDVLFKFYKKPTGAFHPEKCLLSDGCTEENKIRFETNLCPSNLELLMLVQCAIEYLVPLHSPYSCQELSVT